VDGFTGVLGDFAALNATMAVQFPQVKLTDTGKTIAANGPDEVVVSGTLESGAVASLHYTGPESPAGNLRWEISGEAGTLLIESGSGHLQYGHLKISGRQGEGELRKLEVPPSYRRCTTAENSHADSVAHAYHAVFEDLRTGADSVPDFADAVKLHRLLDRIRNAAGWNMESGI
jgi:predicted dehydrogenase